MKFKTSPKVEEFKFQVITDLIEKKLPTLLSKDFTKISDPLLDPDSYPIYIYKIVKNVVKYESSPQKESNLDTKEFQLLIELEKESSELILTIRFVDLIMTIENGDELLHFSQMINSNYPLIVCNLDESRRVFFKIKVYLGNNYKESFKKILESIDSLLIICANFYVSCIRSLFYQKPSKENLKYPIFIEWIKHSVSVNMKAINYNYEREF